MSELKRLVEAVEPKYTLSDEQAEDIIGRMRRFVSDYVYKNKLKSLVVGVSGGLDSAVIAALCQEKYIGVPLIGLHIPLSTTDKHSEQAGWVGANHCTVYDSVHWLDETMETFIPNVLRHNDIIAGKINHGAIRQGNIKARLRMMTLYDMARLNDGLVLSTDNYSEYLAGFWTLHGDVGDLAPIQYIFKGFELPTIARLLGVREDIITQAPSDGLGVTDDNTDEAQLGCDYKTFDAIMVMERMELGLAKNDIMYSPEAVKIYEALKNSDCVDGKVVKGVINRYEGTHFKREGCPEMGRFRLKTD
jgi:nicotinamide-nucleotide amidase